jgi:hypothetical protein
VLMVSYQQMQRSFSLQKLCPMLEPFGAIAVSTEKGIHSTI